MANDSPQLLAKLDELVLQYDAIERDLADPSIVSKPDMLRTLGVKRAALADLVEQYRRFKSLESQAAEHREIIAEEDDTELVSMAAAELPELETEAAGLLESIANELVTADDRAVGSVILELRAGTGGAEAAIWAGDLLQMYERFAALKHWKFDLLDAAEGDQGGVRHAVATVSGPGVWQGLGYDAGVHCVKRVPATESQGRIHTSTATVAVLPEPEQVEIEIPESEVQVDVTTAQGPGGQNVNKVATAVHLIHLPTGIEVRMQESKSQHQNRQKAWQLLRARVYDHFQKLKDAERAEDRAAMIGRGERSERIRTYRWKENIVVDHRLNQSFPLPALLNGDLSDMVDALIAEDRARRLAAL